MMNNDLDRIAIIAANPLDDYCRARGWELRRAGKEWVMLCPLHEEHTPSCYVNPEKQVFNCFGCGAAGSVIDLHMRLRGIDAGEAMRELSPNGANGAKSSSVSAKPKKPTTAATTTAAEVEVAAYDYCDPTGRVRFQVVRFEPKTFKQCKIVDGKRVWSMDGVERLPYRLPELLSTDEVWIAEGEKDVDALFAAGQTATCNPGGAGKWLPAFSQLLNGKCVFIVPDRDDVGEKHAKSVLQSLAGIVKWVKWVELPIEFNEKPIKDIGDMRAACETVEEFRKELERFKARARLIERGIESRCYTMLELEAAYIAEKTTFTDVALDLGKWMTELKVRPLGPGDLFGLIAYTGQCKTAAVQNILACNSTLPGIFFQLELSAPQMFERAAAISTGYEAWRISQIYDEGLTVNWAKSAKFANLLTCTANLSMAEIDAEIARSTAKLGRMPRVFVIDYAQLVKGRGSRYDKMSETCEEAKRLAKKWNAIGIIISQVGRPAKDDSDSEVGLYDAKESGSFENSCGLVLGVWKVTQTDMVCKVLKNTRGYAGQEVSMVLRDNTYIIGPNDLSEGDDDGDGAIKSSNPF